MTHTYQRKRRRSSTSLYIAGNYHTNGWFILWTTIFTVVLVTTTTSASEVPDDTTILKKLPLTYQPTRISNNTINDDNDNNNAYIPSIISHVACAGESFSHRSAAGSYRYRSCQFQNLCYCTETKEYILFPSREEVALQELLQKLHNNHNNNNDFVTISSMVHDTHSSFSTKKVSLGTIIRSHVPTQDSSSLWFPNVITDPDQQKKMIGDGYYQLPNDTVVFPILLPSPTLYTTRRSMDVLLWLDFFAIHTVLSMFGMEQSKQPIFMIQNEHNETSESVLSSPLWSIFGPETFKHMGRFHTNNNDPISMNIDQADGVPATTTTTTTSTTNLPKSNLICSKHGVAGLGMIATIRDESKLLFTHAMGRGAMIYTFRNYILSNLGLPISPLPPPLTTATTTTTTAAANKQTKIQITMAGLTEIEFNTLDKELRTLLVDVVEIEIRKIDDDLPFHESIALTSTSMIHITHRHTPSHLLATATCLPRGATLIVLDTMSQQDTSDTDDKNSIDRMVSRAEQDYLEMAGYFNVHWWKHMPLSVHMDHIDIIRTIVRDKLQSIVDP